MHDVVRDLRHARAALTETSEPAPAPEVTSPPPAPAPRKRRWLRTLIATLVIAAAVGAGFATGWFVRPLAGFAASEFTPFATAPGWRFSPSGHPMAALWRGRPRWTAPFRSSPEAPARRAHPSHARTPGRAVSFLVSRRSTASSISHRTDCTSWVRPAARRSFLLSGVSRPRSLPTATPLPYSGRYRSAPSASSLSGP